MRKGYILVLATFIIASSVLLISLVVNRVNAYRHMSVVWSDIEKARCLALSGIQIGMSQLSVLYVKETQEPQAKEEKEAKAQKANQDDKSAPARVLFEVLNTWQTFPLTEKNEGIDGECRLYISSEEGKINLNGLYDFKKQQLSESSSVSTKKIATFLTDGLRSTFERTRKKPISFMRAFESFFKNRSKPVNDPTELITVPELSGIQESLFVTPEGKDVVVTDLFTTFTSTPTINPLLLSKSLAQISGLTLSKNSLKDPKILEELSALIQSQSINWESSWNKVLAKVYSKEYRALPDTLKALLPSRFEAQLFSVISYGKVGSITQRVCAIIEKNKNTSDGDPLFVCKRLYWI